MWSAYSLGFSYVVHMEYKKTRIQCQSQQSYADISPALCGMAKSRNERYFMIAKVACRVITLYHIFVISYTCSREKSPVGASFERDDLF